MNYWSTKVGANEGKWFHGFETSHYFPININSVSNGIEEDYDIETKSS